MMLMQQNVISDLQNIKGENLKICLINGQTEVFLQLESFINLLKEQIHNLELEIKKEKLPIYPALKITNKKEHIHLYYTAIPEGREWDPFLKALKAISTDKTFLDQTTLEKIKNIKKSVEIKVFITPICPFCPVVVGIANQLAIAQPLIKTLIIDGTLCPELVGQYKITGTPTVVINEDYFLAGTEAKEKLIDFLEKAAEEIYDGDVLKNLLKQARAERVVELCQKDKKHLETLLSLLTAPELFTRIGVMRVLEELAEQEKIKEQILPVIVMMLDTKTEERDKGDILYLLGLIGNLEVIPAIQKVAKGASPTLKEIALEAIEQIKKREMIH